MPLDQIGIVPRGRSYRHSITEFLSSETNDDKRRLSVLVQSGNVNKDRASLERDQGKVTRSSPSSGILGPYDKPFLIAINEYFGDASKIIEHQSSSSSDSPLYSPRETFGLWLLVKIPDTIPSRAAVGRAKNARRNQAADLNRDMRPIILT